MRSGGATNRIFTNFMVLWPFHVKHRAGWLSCGWWFLRTVFFLIVAEELAFHVKPENSRKFFLTVGGMRLDFSIGHNAWLLFSNSFSVSVFAWCGFLFFWGGGLHRRIFVLWLERWVYWVGCRVSRETFCWIISRLVELIQICLWEWLKLEAYSVVGKVHSRQQKTIRKEHAI